MKTLKGLFRRNSDVKIISDFSIFSLNSAQMIAIKGGTEPIGTDPGEPTPPKVFGDI